MSTDYASFRHGPRYLLYKSFANRISRDTSGDGRTNRPAMTSHGLECANKSSLIKAIGSLPYVRKLLAELSIPQWWW